MRISCWFLQRTIEVRVTANSAAKNKGTGLTQECMPYLNLRINPSIVYNKFWNFLLSSCRTKNSVEIHNYCFRTICRVSSIWINLAKSIYEKTE